MHLVLTKAFCPYLRKTGVFIKAANSVTFLRYVRSCCFEAKHELVYSHSLMQRRLLEPFTNVKRNLFSLPKLFGGSTKCKEFSERKILNFSMDEMYEVVADVDAYQDFLPWCKKSLVTSRQAGCLTADMVIGFPPFLERYSSVVTLQRPHLIKASCTDGIIFKHMETIWRFSPGFPNKLDTCTVDFRVCFEFHSRFHSKVVNIYFDEVVEKMVKAFYTQAQHRFGHKRKKFTTIS